MKQALTEIQCVDAAPAQAVDSLRRGPVPARPVPNVTPIASPMLETTREVEGYDGVRGEVKWWFESWGRGGRNQWTLRNSVGRPPRPDELANADYITIGLEFPDGRVQHRTRIGGLDIEKGK